MSEYQYYEFQAVDRLLSQKERDEIGKISSRTTPTASSAIFTYSYSDFPRDAGKLLAQYFDAMLSLSSWGTRRLMFRFPEQAVDFQAMKVYTVDGLISLSRSDGYVVLDICPYSEQRGGWIDGEGLLSPMLSLRADIISGDYRALYLAWLAGMDSGAHADEDLEPPVPDGLRDLDEAHRELIDFFEIDQDLVEAASASSKARMELAEPDFKSLIALLSTDEKDDFLLGFVNSDPGIHYMFRQRLEALSGESAATSSPGQRTVSDLEALVKTVRAARIAAENAKKEEARLARLNKIARTKDELWKEVYFLIERKTSRYYSEAVDILQELKAAAALHGDLSAFDSKLAILRSKYKSLSSLNGLLKKAGLMGL